jgi:glutamyl-tRNA reductase
MERLLPYLYTYEGEEAVGHLFSVACGLDSQILGETQILGQVKSAFFKAQNCACTDKNLESVFNAAITFSRRMHRETEISAGKVSIGSVAIDFIKEKSGGLLQKNVLIIGAGKVTQLVLKYLKEEKPRVIFISNRSFEKAKQLAFSIEQKAARLDKLPQLLKQADVVITATSSPHFIIKKEALEGVAPRQLLIVDLAIPRDVQPQVRRLKNVDLFNLEDLGFIVQKNLEKKKLEAEKIRELISREAALLWQGVTAREPEPALLP